MKFAEHQTTVFPERVDLSRYTMVDGVYKNSDLVTSDSQSQTQDTFGFKWKKEDTFDSEESLKRMREWLVERYGDAETNLRLVATESDKPLVLDAGCGAGMSGFEYWGKQIGNINYLGVDVSEAVDVARKRFLERNYPSDSGTFIQDSIDNLPFLSPFADIIFSEGVLHHTDDTHKTFSHLSKLLKRGGLFMFYIYRKKAPIREFVDDFIRSKMQSLTPEQGWEELKGLSDLGIALGELKVEVDVPREVKFLDIPAGKIDLQRLFYWYIFKAFYDPKLTFEEMHHINFDWYAPQNAHRHTVDEVKQWCTQEGLNILTLKEDLPGITCIAKKL